MSNVHPIAIEQEHDAEHVRLAPRHRVLKSAKIVLDDWRAIDCMLRDMSDTGAKIKVSSTTNVPHKFRLHITSDNTIRDVIIAWKHHDEIGVAFRSEPKPCALRKL